MPGRITDVARDRFLALVEDHGEGEVEAVLQLARERKLRNPLAWMEKVLRKRRETDPPPDPFEAFRAEQWRLAAGDQELQRYRWQLQEQLEREKGDAQTPADLQAIEQQCARRYEEMIAERWAQAQAQGGAQ